MDTTEETGAGGSSGAGRPLEVRVLPERHRPLVAAPIVEADTRWQKAVGECLVSADGRDLWCVVSCYRDEMLAGFDLEQTPDRIAVRVWLAFGPDGPTTFGRGKVRVLPDGRRVGTMYRQGAGRRWCALVRLDEPLSARPVIDICTPDPHGSGKAYRAWRAARDRSAAH
ncbi:hypothetical protein [Frankia sp. AgKG'84/4]|uniref:hypothetical protein n=1 Tax=Frankia sp. AgKG'84/4 TaxID=573490 RepID=UPI00200EB132|nr:hypothetical protein [Frankia sp. AgKG'84/4]MCL9795220.1 hypothetical protein [Frankia sp. AgKG'84/4]